MIFRNWKNAAWVKKPESTYSLDGGDLFSASLYPAVNHPLVADRGAEFRGRMLAQRLQAFVDFTAKLERQAVNPATLLLADGSLPLQVSTELRRSADIVYLDEAHHARESIRLSDEIGRTTGIMPLNGFYPEALSRLNQILHDSSSDQTWLFQVMFAVISETLISGVLGKIPNDQTVDPAVRQYVAEHARDEGRHHVLFKRVLDELWPQLTDRHIELVGPYIAHFVRWFLYPDHATTRAFLTEHGFSASAVDKVIGDAYPSNEVIADIRAAAAPSLKYLDHVGALSVPSVRDTFEKQGLLI